LIAGMRIINTITGAVMHTQLKNPSTYIFVIAYIAKFYPFKSSGYSSKSRTVMQTIEPFFEWLFSRCISVVGKLVWSCLHGYYVSYTIQYCK